MGQKTIVFRVTLLLAAVAIVTCLSSQSSFAFKDHKEITSDGLLFINDQTLPKIQGSHFVVDTIFQFNDNHHFDNCEFVGSVDRINEYYDEVLSELNPNNIHRSNPDSLKHLQTAAKKFGRILHIAQDFYAHTNWVELGRTDLFDRGTGKWTVFKPFDVVNDVRIVQGEVDDVPTGFVLQRTGHTVQVFDGSVTLPGLISGSAYFTDQCPGGSDPVKKGKTPIDRGFNDVHIGHWDSGGVNIACELTDAAITAFGVPGFSVLSKAEKAEKIVDLVIGGGSKILGRYGGEAGEFIDDAEDLKGLGEGLYELRRQNVAKDFSKAGADMWEFVCNKLVHKDGSWPVPWFFITSPEEDDWERGLAKDEETFVTQGDPESDGWVRAAENLAVRQTENEWCRLLKLVENKYKPAGLDLLVDGWVEDADKKMALDKCKYSAPIADAGENQFVLEGQSVFLDGSRSTDPNNDPITYQWSQLAGKQVQLTGSKTVKPGFTAPDVSSVTTLTFLLKVSDGVQTATDQVDVEVRPITDNLSPGIGLTVTANDDIDDGNCDLPPGHCSLREAINSANTLPGRNTIDFKILGSPSIIPLSELPTITQPVIIDGLTQTGAIPGLPVVELNGNNVRSVGLQLEGGDSTIRGLVINRFLDAGIWLKSKGQNTIEGNFIGTDPGGNIDLGNGRPGGCDLNSLGCQGPGILISNSPNNQIGGIELGKGNVISGNNAGIIIGQAIGAGSLNSTNNRIQGNLIGTDDTGKFSVGNDGVGILISGSDGVNHNLIGGTNQTSNEVCKGACNLISGNRGSGIQVFRQGENIMQGNYIGTDISGQDDIGNERDGIFLSDSTHNIIGGLSQNSRNVVSGNKQNGIAIIGDINPKTGGNIVQGNYIGTDPKGGLPLANANFGLLVFNSTSNIIGGTEGISNSGCFGACNLISGNLFPGVVVAGSAGGYASIQGNYIGTTVNGLQKLPNDKAGIALILGTSNNNIGGDQPEESNIIAGNIGQGILISQASNNNGIEGNFIGTERGLGPSIGNTENGIAVSGSANNEIGGQTQFSQNTIAYNGFDGIAIKGKNAVSNLIVLNSIHGNGLLGIDLGDNGHTENNSTSITDDDNPNGYMVYPNGTYYYDSETGRTIIGGFLRGISNPSTAVVELYSNQREDLSGFGEGQKWLGQVAPDKDGFFAIGINEDIPSSQYPIITATAIDTKHSTSEFSPAFLQNSPPVAKITGSNETVIPNGISIIDGSESFDTDGVIKSYSWIQLDGPITVNLNSTTSKAVQFVAPLIFGNATYKFSLTVTDDDGATSTANTTVRIRTQADPNGPSDADGDGIVDQVDIKPDTFSNEFSDKPIDGNTNGSITHRGTLSLLVNDAEDQEDGVSVTATSIDAGSFSTPGRVLGLSDLLKPSILKLCGGAANIYVTYADSATITCGSADILVNNGSVATQFLTDSGKSANVTIPKNNKLVFHPDSSLLIASSSNHDTLTIVLDGDQTVTLSPGQSKVLYTGLNNIPPIANAGQDTSISEGTKQVKLNGSKSIDPDGFIKSFEWEQILGPTVVLRNANSSVANFDVPVISNQTLLTFNLTVIDNMNATSSDTVNIQVKNDNVKPVTFGQSVTGEINSFTNPFLLKGSDANGQKLNFTIVRQPYNGTIGTVSFSDPVDGHWASYLPNLDFFGKDNFTFVANDGIESSDPALVTVTVKNDLFKLNLRADAGLDKFVQTGAKVILDGSNSVDPNPDGKISSYTWTQTLGPAVSLNGTNTPAVEFTAPSNFNGSMTLEFSVKVTSTKGLSSTDSVRVIVTRPGLAGPKSLDQVVFTGFANRQITLLATDSQPGPITYSITKSPTSSGLRTLTGVTINSPPSFGLGTESKVTFVPNTFGATTYADIFRFNANNGVHYSNTSSVCVVVDTTGTMKKCLPSTYNPVSVAFDYAGDRTFIANLGDIYHAPTLLTLDASKLVISNITLVHSPVRILYNPITNNLFIRNHDCTVTVLDSSSLNVINNIKVGNTCNNNFTILDNENSIVLDPSKNRVYVINHGRSPGQFGGTSDWITILEGDGRLVTSIKTSHLLYSATVDTHTGKLYISDLGGKQILVFNTSTFDFETPIVLVHDNFSHLLRTIEFNPVNSFLYFVFDGRIHAKNLSPEPYLGELFLGPSFFNIENLVVDPLTGNVYISDCGGAASTRGIWAMSPVGGGLRAQGIVRSTTYCVGEFNINSEENQLYAYGGMVQIAAKTPPVPPRMHLPVANNDYIVIKNTTNTVMVDALLNDTDPDNNGLEIISATNGTYGNVRLIPSDSELGIKSHLEYDPGPSFENEDRFNYTISDGIDGNSSAMVTIRKAAYPVADAGENILVDEGATVYLNGSLSSDPDGSIVSYEWSRTFGDEVQLDSSFGKIVSFVAPTDGRSPSSNPFSHFGFRLNVTDNDNLSDIDFVNVTVKNLKQNNRVPITDGDLTFFTTQNKSVDIQLGAFDDDRDDIVQLFPVDGPSSGKLKTKEFLVGLAAFMNPFYEVPPVDSSASARLFLKYDNLSKMARYFLVLDNPLSSPEISTDIHIGDDNTNGPVEFTLPKGFSNGTELGLGKTGRLGPLSEEQVRTLFEGRYYVNIHTTNFPAGELRAQINVNGEGYRIVEYTPNSNFIGIDSFTYKANDGYVDSGISNVTIYVDPRNDPPVANDDYITVNEGAQKVIPVLDNDTDIDGDEISLIEVSSPANGYVIFNDNQTITYVSNQGFSGSDTFTYTITDDINDPVTGNVFVNVLPVNSIPGVYDLEYSTFKNQIAQLDLDAYDDDSDIIDIKIGKSPIHGQILNASLQQGFTGHLTTQDSTGGGVYGYRYLSLLYDNSSKILSYFVIFSATPFNSVPSTPEIGAHIHSGEPGQNGPEIFDLSGSYTKYDGGTFSYIYKSGTLGPLSEEQENALHSRNLYVDIHTEAHPEGELAGQILPQGYANLVVLYMPEANFVGNDTLGYVATDGVSQSRQGNVTIHVLPSNQIITLPNDDTLITDEDAPITFDPLSNDIIDPSSNVSMSISSQPENGSLAVISNGNITYTPAPDFYGQDSFRYVLVNSNDNTASSEALVNITIRPTNDYPDLHNDTATGNEDSIIKVNVLSNDTDIDKDELVLIRASQPKINGSEVIAESNGTIAYIPASNFYGNDSFYYEASDSNGGHGNATVSVIVYPLNDSPHANDDKRATSEDIPIVIPVLDNDTDVDGDRLSLVKITIAPAHGEAVTNGNSSITYTPDSNYNGNDSLTYAVFDGNGGNSSAAVKINVAPLNDNPVANSDSIETDEQKSLLIDILSNDTDVDNDQLVISEITQPHNGTAIIQGDKINYTSVANFGGIDLFKYTVLDGNGGSATANVTVKVNAVNELPVANGGSISVFEDIPQQITLNASDPDGDQLTFSVVTSPLQGTISNFDSGDGSLLFTPKANFSGQDSFTFKVNDSLLDSNIANISINVTSVNDQPDARDDVAQTDEDAVVNIPVLNNDIDVEESDVLQITDIATAPNKGAAAINTNGTIGYEPSKDFNGQDSFAYTISDGHGGSDSAQVLITVDSINDYPIANVDRAVTNESTSVMVDVLANDSDIDNDTLEITTLTPPVNGQATIEDSKIKYSPNNKFHGIDTFEYSISDGKGGTGKAEILIEVKDINEAPIAISESIVADEDIARQIRLNSTDGDGDAVTYSVISQPAHGIITDLDTNSGILSYTSAANFNGADSFSFKVNDGKVDSEVGTVSISVKAINDMPVANDDVATSNEGTPVIIKDILTNDNDPDSDHLTIISVSSPLHGSAIANDDKSSITYTPVPGFHGQDSLEYTISDGNGGTAKAKIVITVIHINHSPNAESQQVETETNRQIQITLKGSDPDQDDTITFQKVTDPSKGAITGFDANTGILTYTPNNGFIGTDTFTFEVVDNNNAQSEAATVTIIVKALPNKPPVVQDVNVETNQGTAKLIQLKASDPDTGDTLTFALVSGPTSGEITNFDKNSGKLTYVPKNGFFGTDAFKFKTTDNHGSDSNTATVSITVKQVVVNHPPVANNQNLETKKNAAKDIVLTGKDPDAGDTITFGITTGPEKGQISNFNKNSGKLTYTPNSGFYGTDSFKFKVTDNHGAASNIATVSITVKQVIVNNPPDCTKAAPSNAELWPPNHKMVAITIKNVNDPEKTPISIKITKILQDEPVDGLGDGDTSPDASGIGTDTALLRAERSGNGDGRVYHLFFTATEMKVGGEGNDDGDDKHYGNNYASNTYTTNHHDHDDDDGNDPKSCTGQVIVSVRHDQSHKAVDSGPKYDSTIKPNTAPTANSQTVHTQKNTPVSIVLKGSDADGDKLTFSIFSQPKYGTIKDFSSYKGSLTYNPGKNFVGEDKIFFKVNDGKAESSPGTISIVVKDGKYVKEQEERDQARLASQGTESNQAQNRTLPT